MGKLGAAGRVPNLGTRYRRTVTGFEQFLLGGISPRYPKHGLQRPVWTAKHLLTLSPIFRRLLYFYVFLGFELREELPTLINKQADRMGYFAQDRGCE